jgi:hypothetical protein
MTYSGVVDADVTTLERFLDTIEHGDKPDDLADVTGLERWAGDGPGRASRADLARARKLRGALHGVLSEPLAPASRGRLAEATRPFMLRSGDPSVGEGPLVPIGAGMHAALGRVVAGFANARATGAIDRLKLCANCGWAFIDESRNRSRRWCEMASCGNQSKVRAYRRRRRMKPGTSGAAGTKRGREQAGPSLDARSRDSAYGVSSPPGIDASATSRSPR